VPARDYEFKIAKLWQTGMSEKEFLKLFSRNSSRNSYSRLMQHECAQYGMKPVCNDLEYCATDAGALYIGHRGQLSNPSRARSMPRGFDQVSRRFEGLCFYVGKTKAACNIPVKSGSWKMPAQANPGFICGSVRPPL
jgi:hypothetical protein